MATQTKTRNAASDAFSNSAFDFATANENFRAMAEESLAQASQIGEKFYAQARATTKEATDAAEKTAAAVSDGYAELAAKSLEISRANMEAGVAFIEKLSGAKTVADALELQGEYFRNQFDALARQAKEAAELTTQVSEKAAAPAKEAIDKTSAALTNKS